MANFERTDAYMAKLFELAMFDEKRVIQDATVVIERDPSNRSKLKAYCKESDTYLQFPRCLRENEHTDLGKVYRADVVEVVRNDGVQKYYRAMKGSIRADGSDKVLA